MTTEHEQQVKKIGSGEWVRLAIMAGVYLVAAVWQMSELKTEFRVRLSQLETLVRIYQENDMKNNTRIGDHEVRIVKLEERARR